MAAQASDAAAPPSETVLEVTDLAVSFELRSGTVRAVDGVSFAVGKGEIVGVLGESGSGKSVTMLAVFGLVPQPGRITGGSVRLDGTDLVTMRRGELTRLRGQRLAYIPPDPGAALNPVTRVGKQVAEGLVTHSPELSAAQRRSRVVEMLEKVGLPNPAVRARQYPHQLSGGMQQRVAIAMGVQLGPSLLIADEPTTALDVTIQAQILRLLLDIRDDSQTSILYVTHDVTTIAEICDRVLVMYAGQIVESGRVAEVCTQPAHPYTQALLRAVPPLGGPRPEVLETIPGVPPSPQNWPSGCRFAERCQLRRQLQDPEECTTQASALQDLEAGRQSRCHFIDAAKAAWQGGTP
jgi:peptide/nickel transport system ATP-binding protein